MDMTTSQRRPRIPATLAAQIDMLREDIPFEAYVATVLERHVRRYQPDADRVDPDAQRILDFDDPDGAYLWLDKVDGGWGEHKRPGVLAGLAVEDAGSGFDAVGVHLDRTHVRALRDALTELLGEYES